MRLAALLLAAGASRRMRGGDKLLEVVGGRPLIRERAEMLLAAGLPVRVALPCPGTARRAALDGLAVTAVDVPDAAQGMAASIRAGIAALPPGLDGVLILPADMPEITAEDIRTACAAFGGKRPLRATSADGVAGHPVLFPARLFPDLLRLGGDSGAKDLLKREGFDRVPLPGRHALTDLDTPEDWAAWRAGGERG